MLGVALTRSPPRPDHAPARRRRARREDAHECGARRRRRLTFYRTAARDLDPLEQNRRRRRGDREPAMRRLHPPGAERDGPIIYRVDAESHEPFDGPYD